MKNVAFLYTNNELLKNLIKQSHLQLHQKGERCIFWKLQDTNEIKITQISGNYSNGLEELILLKCPNYQKAIYSFITVIKISIALSTKQLFWNLYGSTHQKKKKKERKENTNSQSNLEKEEQHYLSFSLTSNYTTKQVIRMVWTQKQTHR